jgi:NADH:ubiquinone oxidoreductase subunit 6 (subunit J)
MILEVLSAGLLITACLAIFLEEAVYSVVALAGTFLFTALLYWESDAPLVAVFQFAVGAGTLAILFLSGEMLSERPLRKTSLKNVVTVAVFGGILSLVPIFLNISSPGAAVADVSFGEALWNLNATDVVLQGLVIMTVAMGIAIVLYQKKKSGGAK